MPRVLRAELLRVGSGRVLAALLLVAAFLDAVSIAGNGGRQVDAVHAGTATVAAASHDLLRLGFGALLFATVHGVVLATSEFRSGSVIRSSFNAGAPERLLAAKALVALVSGAAFGVAAVASAIAASALVLAVHGEHLVLDAESARIAAGVFAVCALAGPWGVLIGWVVRAQVSAIVGIMAWTLVAESAVVALAPAIGRFLPGGAQASMYRDAGGDALSWPWGFVLFAGWLALAAVAAVALERRRDLA